ncbi:MAG: hypothetical protein ACLFQ5_09370 [Oceanicaulis sp.]
MSRAASSAPGRVHPLARPFQTLSGRGAGLMVIAAAAAFLLISFAVEFFATGGEGWSKYPDVLGGYEILPAVALAAAILAAWAVRGLLSASAGFYEREDVKTRDGDLGGTVGAPGDEAFTPAKAGSATRD